MTNPANEGPKPDTDPATPRAKRRRQSSHPNVPAPERPPPGDDSPRASSPLVLSLVFGACLILTVGIIGTLLGRYVPRDSEPPANRVAPSAASTPDAAAAR